MIGLADVQAAAAAIDGGIVRTPLVRAEALDEIAGAPVWLKAELLQHTGSFKLRGALNRMQALTDEERARGVITVSAGNHAAAVARAGAAVGTDVLVLMARAASPPKVTATRGYGATVDLESADAKEAFARMEAIAAETGRVVVAPVQRSGRDRGRGHRRTGDRRRPARRRPGGRGRRRRRADRRHLDGAARPGAEGAPGRRAAGRDRDPCRLARQPAVPRRPRCSRPSPTP